MRREPARDSSDFTRGVQAVRKTVTKEDLRNPAPKSHNNNLEDLDLGIGISRDSFAAWLVASTAALKTLAYR
jgi:hypothetical protein